MLHWSTVLLCHVYVIERVRRMLRFNRSVSEPWLQTWGSDTWVSLCSVLVLVLVSDLRSKYSASLLKMCSVSAGSGTPAHPRFLDACKSWFIPDEHIFSQLLAGHESKPSSRAHVLRIHYPRLFQSKPCSLFFTVVCWEVLGFMASSTLLVGKLRFALCTNILSRGFRQMLFPTIATYSVLYI